MPNEPEPLSPQEEQALDDANRHVAEREAVERLIDSAVDPRRQN